MKIENFAILKAYGWSFRELEKAPEPWSGSGFMEAPTIFHFQRGAQDGSVWNRRACVVPLGKWPKDKAGRKATGELWADVKKCLWIGILGTTKFSGKWGYELAVERINGKRKEQGRWKVNIDDLSMGAKLIYKMAPACRAGKRGNGIYAAWKRRVWKRKEGMRKMERITSMERILEWWIVEEIIGMQYRNAKG